MPNFSDLVKKPNYDVKVLDVESTSFTPCDYNKVMTNIPDAKIKNKKLVNESDISGFIDNSDLNKTIKKLATKAELKAEQDKIAKRQIYDSSIFIGQSYVFNDGSQNFLIFQPTLKTFTMLSALSEKIIRWKSKNIAK